MLNLGLTACASGKKNIPEIYRFLVNIAVCMLQVKQGAIFVNQNDFLLFRSFK
jgi:hypothetical protein